MTDLVLVLVIIAVALIVVGAALWSVARAFLRANSHHRSPEFIAFAHEHGLTIDEGAHPGVITDQLAALPTFRLNPKHGAHHVVSGQWRGWSFLAFNLRSSPAGGWVAAVDVPSLDPDGPFVMIESGVGTNARPPGLVPFRSMEFSRLYHVTSPDYEHAWNLLSPDVTDVIEQRGWGQIEIAGRWIMTLGFEFAPEGTIALTPGRLGDELDFLADLAQALGGGQREQPS